MKYTKLILKNILRNKRRTFLTVSSLVVSLFLIITLATVLTEFARGSEQANPLRVYTRHSVSLTFPLPAAAAQKIAGVPGVAKVMPYSWFGGIYKDQKNFFANFACDPKLTREIFSELRMTDAEWQAFANDRQGCIVGQKLVTRFGFTLGQRITLHSPIYNADLEFIVRGIYTGRDEKTMYFSSEYLNESFPVWAKDKVGLFAVLVDRPENLPSVCKAIDSMFLNTDAPTKSESESEFAASFQAMYGGVKTFMYVIMGAIIFSLLLVMANTMAMTVRERTKEVGTLKALGFGRGVIAWMFVGESVLVATIGGLIGIGGAALLYRAVDISVFIPNFPSFRPLPETLIAAFTIALVVGVVSVIYSANRVSRMTIADSLRSTE